MAKQEDKLARAKEQAQLQYESIAEMVQDLNKAREADDQEAIDAAEDTIRQGPLEIAVRSDWHAPCNKSEETEYMVLLCTGGPACRIVGELSQYQEPETARIEYQDWFTSWEDWPIDSEQEQIVLMYAQCFYFGS